MLREPHNASKLLHRRKKRTKHFIREVKTSLAGETIGGGSVAPLDPTTFGWYKSLTALGVVLICFGLLWPRIFQPMLMFVLGIHGSGGAGDGDDGRFPPNMNPAAAGRGMNPFMAAGQGEGPVPGRPPFPAGVDPLSAAMNGGPHPGMRMAAQMAAAGNFKQGAPVGGSKHGSFGGMLLPVYSIGVIVFLLYMLSKIFFKDPQPPMKAQRHLAMGGRPMADGDSHQLKTLQKRLVDTEGALQRILEQLGAMSANADPRALQQVRSMAATTLNNLSQLEEEKQTLLQREMEDDSVADNSGVCLDDLETALSDFQRFTSDYVANATVQSLGTPIVDGGHAVSACCNGDPASVAGEGLYENGWLGVHSGEEEGGDRCEHEHVPTDAPLENDGLEMTSGDEDDSSSGDDDVDGGLLDDGHGEEWGSDVSCSDEESGSESSSEDGGREVENEEKMGPDSIPMRSHQHVDIAAGILVGDVAYSSNPLGGEIELPGVNFNGSGDAAASSATEPSFDHSSTVPSPHVEANILGDKLMRKEKMLPDSLPISGESDGVRFRRNVARGQCSPAAPGEQNVPSSPVPAEGTEV